MWLENVIFIANAKQHGRASEWFLAVLLTGWGVTLLHPGTTFQGLAYRAFESGVMGEAPTGVFVSVLGIVWCWGLWYNGRKSTLTSTVRASCAFGGAVIFSMFSGVFLTSFLLTNSLNTGVWTYLMLSMLSLYNLSRIIQHRGERSHGLVA